MLFRSPCLRQKIFLFRPCTVREHSLHKKFFFLLYSQCIYRALLIVCGIQGDAKVKSKICNSILRLLVFGAFLLTAPLLTSCVGTGISIGAGSGGVGVGMHSGYYTGYGYGWPGFGLGYGRWGHRHGGGVMVGVPVTSGPGIPVGYADYPVGERYPVQRVYPDRDPITEASHANWNRWDSLYHSPLPYYRGRSFLKRP